jgi:hypothetical protein
MVDNIDQTDLIDLKAVAAKAHVTDRTVRNWASEKREAARRLWTRKVGGVRRTTWQAFAMFMDNCSGDSEVPMLLTSAGTRHISHAEADRLLMERHGI